MTNVDVSNAVNPYLTDVGVGLVFGLGYYLIKYIYGDKEKSEKVKNFQSSSTCSFENAKNIEEFNHMIKLQEENPKLNPFEILDQINKKQLTPDTNTYNNLLNACYTSDNFDLASKLVDEIFDFACPLQPDLSTFNILLKGISCKLDLVNVNDNEDRKIYVEKTDRIYSDMGKLSIKPNDITINTTLDILIKAGEIQRAWDLFDNMKLRYEVEPDKYSYSTIIKALKYEPDPTKLEKAFGILEYLKHKNSSGANDEIIFNCLIDVCIRLNKMEKAERVFSQMKKIGIEPSKITYAIMIKGYGQVYNIEKAFEVFEEMKLSNMPPNEIIYGCLLNSCVRCANITKVTEVYREMKQHNLDMNIVLYTTLIKAYTKVRDLNSALDVYYSMLGDPKVVPNIIAHNAILDCCVECNETAKLNDIYSSIKQKAISSASDESVPQPDLITYSTVIKGYCRAKDMEKVFDIYRFLKAHPNEFKLDEVIYNSILDGCSKTGNLEIAMKVYEDMVNSQIKKSNVTYSILIKLYANSKQEEKALSMLEEMEGNGIKPGIIVYTCLIQTCLKAKKFEKAISLFEKMKADKQRADHVLYNTIINGCLYNSRWELACGYTLESFSENIKVANDIYRSVLDKLTAHYCNLSHKKKADYATKILKELKERGLEIPEETYSRVGKMIYQYNGTKVEYDLSLRSSNQKPNRQYDVKRDHNKDQMKWQRKNK